MSSGLKHKTYIQSLALHFLGTKHTRVETNV